MTLPESDSATSLPLTHFYDAAEIDGTFSADNFDESSDSDPSSTYVYLRELLMELGPSADESLPLDAEESIDSGLLFAEDFPVPPVFSSEDQERINCYSQLEESVEIPDF